MSNQLATVRMKREKRGKKSSPPKGELVNTYDKLCLEIFGEKASGKGFWVIHIDEAENERGFTLRKEKCTGPYSHNHGMSMMPGKGDHVLASHLVGEVTAVDGFSTNRTIAKGCVTFSSDRVTKIKILKEDVTKEVLDMLE